MTLTVRLPESIESQLTRFCEAMGVSKSQVVQGALKDWFVKPVLSHGHPLLVFVETSVKAAPSSDWVGPYTKDRLREQVLASGNTLAVNESVVAYQAAGRKTAASRKVPKISTKNSATKATRQRKTDTS